LKHFGPSEAKGATSAMAEFLTILVMPAIFRFSAKAEVFKYRHQRLLYKADDRQK